LNGELNLMKKNRVFSEKFKAEAVRRMQSGESPSALARALQLRRKLLYEWRNAVLAGQPLRRAGRPKQRPDAGSGPENGAARVRELERLVGQLTLENRFFKGALRRIKELRQQNSESGAAASSRRSKR
jgi:transposase-like protein